MLDEQDDRDPSPSRQVELAQVYEAAAKMGSEAYAYRGVRIATRGELDWIMRDRGWSGSIEAGLDVRPVLRGARFERVNLNEVELYRADLTDANFYQAELRRALLVAATLLDCILERSSLREARLAGATLAQSNLRHIDLSSADLTRADLRASDLSHANLRGADLFGADLRGARLVATDLRGADLSHAEIDDKTQVQGLIMNDRTRLGPSLLSRALE